MRPILQEEEKSPREMENVLQILEKCPEEIRKGSHDNEKVSLNKT